MSALISCLFFLALAVNTIYSARRQGRWSWPQFFVVVAALIMIPIGILVPLMHVGWLEDKPVAFTLIVTGLILLSVTAFALVLNKCWPLPNKKPGP